MVILYRGHCVRITHEVFELRCPAYRAYELRGLLHVRVVEQTADPPPILRVASTGSTSAAGATAVVAVLGWTEGWQAIESPVGILVVLVLLVASATTRWACWRTLPVEQELVADYQGRPVTLYRSTDHLVFGQVRRGLLRALQHRNDTR